VQELFPQGDKAMARIGEPYIVVKRGKSFQFTLNSTCGLPQRICDEWQRRSFRTLPDELSNYRNPKTKPEAKSYVQILIAFLKKKLEAGSLARRIVTEDITVGDWLKKFISIETSPRTGINIAENGSCSEDSILTYESYFRCHIEGDPILELKMAEVDRHDVIDLSTRMAIKKIGERKNKAGEIISPGREMGGTRTFVGVIKFFRMAFKNYESSNENWVNPYRTLKEPKYESVERDAFSEEEILKFFSPGVFLTTMELAVGAAIFWAGLRRSEVFALKPEDLDWHNQVINVRRTWQCFDNKNKKKLGPTKGKRSRKTLFDPILQNAIKKLWEKNGQHEYVFSYKKPFRGSITPGASWIKHNFDKWLSRAGIERNGRDIVPHSARHSLATFLLDKGVPIKHIQELLGHAHLKVTKRYTHLLENTMKEIGKKVISAREEHQAEPEKIVEFKVS
jgi:integrase/recombinase XerD